MLITEIDPSLGNVPVFHYRNMDVLREEFFNIGKDALEKGVLKAPFSPCIIQLDDFANESEINVKIVFLLHGDEVTCIMVAFDVIKIICNITKKGTDFEVSPNPEVLHKLGPEQMAVEVKRCIRSYLAAWGGLHCSAFTQTKHTVSDGIKRHREKCGLPPLSEPIVLRVSPRTDLSKSGYKIHLPRADVRGHDRRGHPCNYKNGKTVWIKNQKVKGGAEANRNYEVKS